MVDGNGILHPRGNAFRRIHDSFLLGKKCQLPIYRMQSPQIAHTLAVLAGCGLACHLGVLANLPTIGIGKNVSRRNILILVEFKTRNL